MNKINILLFTALLFSVAVSAQKIITIDDAVSIALKNNYDILIARNDADIAHVNNTLGNAGMLPSVSANATENHSINNVKQKYATGADITKSGANTNSLSAALALNWTLYDGGKMFVTRRKLAEIEALGEVQFKDEVQQSVYNVIVAYFNVVKQKQQLESIRKVTSYNSERVQILQTGFAAGLSPKNNLLQAKIDLNVNHESALSQETVIVQAKRNLAQLLGQSSDSVNYEVVDSIPLIYIPDKSVLASKLYNNNTSVQAGQKQIDIAQLSVKETNTQFYPKLSFNAGYNFSQTDNSVGTTLLNRSTGPVLGGSISIPLYQAGNASRQSKTAKLQLLSANQSFESIKILVNTQLQNALSDFENQQKLLSIETENAELARENLEISLQRLRLGQTTSLEMRQAQQSYEESLTRLVNFRYNLKVAETKLKQLMGEL